MIVLINFVSLQFVCLKTIRPFVNLKPDVLLEDIETEALKQQTRLFEHRG